MICPGCSAAVDPLSPRCLSCGVDLPLLQQLAHLEKEVAETLTLSREMARRSEALQTDLRSFRSLVAEGSRVSPPSAPLRLPGEALVATSAVEAPPAAAPLPPVDGVLAPVSPVDGASAPPPTAGVVADEVKPLSTPVTHSPPGSHARRLPPPLHRPSPQVEPRHQEARPAPSPGGAEVLFGQKWLLVGGVIILVLGIAYFLKYAFDQNWIGPAGRVAMAYLAGMACLGAGEVTRRRGLESFGLYLIGGGIAVLYFSCYACFAIYELLPQTPSFALMILITVLAGVLATVYNTMWLAILGMVGGFATPLLLSTGQDNQVGLMTYMVILNLGMLGLASKQQWALLNSLGFFFTWALFGGYYSELYNESKFWLTLFYLNIFFLIYAVVPFLYYIRTRESGSRNSYFITIPNAFIAFAFSYDMIVQPYGILWLSLVSVSYAAVFLRQASILYHGPEGDNRPFVMMVSTGLLFLIITVPLLFSGYWITIFWAVQVATLVWAALRLSDRRLFYSGILLLTVVLWRLYWVDYDRWVSGPAWPGARLNHEWPELAVDRLLVSGVVLAACYGVATLVSRSTDTIRERVGGPATWWTVFGINLFFVLNLEVVGFFRWAVEGSGAAAGSILWASFGLGLMILGFRLNVSTLRRWSLFLFGITVFKVFARDMQDVSTPFRILSFMVLGLLLIGASYLYHRFKSSILPPEKTEDSIS